MIKSFRALLILPTGHTFFFLNNIMIKVNQHALINLVYSYMGTKVFNIQPVLFHQNYLCHLLWFKKQSFTLVWKPNPPLLSRLCTFALVLMQWVSVGSTHEASRWMCISSRDQWNLTPATMCRGSAARALYEAETLEQQTMHFAQVRPRFFLLGKKKWGGRAINRQTAIFVAASPRWEKIQYRHSPKHQYSISTCMCVGKGFWGRSDRSVSLSPSSRLEVSEQSSEKPRSGWWILGTGALVPAETSRFTQWNHA